MCPEASKYCVWRDREKCSLFTKGKGCQHLNRDLFGTRGFSELGELNHLHRFLDSTFAASFVIYYTFWQIFIFVSLKVILWKVQKLDQKTVQKNTGTWIKNVTCMREIYISR